VIPAMTLLIGCLPGERDRVSSMGGRRSRGPGLIASGQCGVA
jgi:hypothetical protein